MNSLKPRSQWDQFSTYLQTHLARDCWAQVNFSGCVTQRSIDRLIKYLEVMRDAWATDDAFTEYMERHRESSARMWRVIEGHKRNAPLLGRRAVDAIHGDADDQDSTPPTATLADAMNRLTPEQAKALVPDSVRGASFEDAAAPAEVCDE